ncbi:hypothetical protein D3C72_1666500 [compost metagenome]
MPEHVAVRAVGVTEQVDNTRRIGLAVGDPGGFLHLRPDFFGHRRIDQFFQWRFAQVLALFVEQAANQYMFTIRRQVQRHPPVLVFGCVTTQAVGGIKAAFDLHALGFHLLHCFGQRFGHGGLAGQQADGEGQGQFQQSVHVSFLEVLVTAGAGVRSKDSRAWLRLARDSSPK